ncbi:DUF6348 family protein [Bacteroides sp. 224]|uniref:DUF6348 family protein n=1 Tax=Bacteroides sp. 224 TaxID=2302936 RepID=UPI0013D16A8C|nr:DUF6348 family protein [Bacteroides sp. 224]NDV66154.1 hypothetical protein [Bacteroides sp. 224]
MNNQAFYLELLEKTFKNHHINCYIEESALIFPQQYIEAQVSFFDRTSSMPMVQMDVTFSIGLAKHIIESVAGFGDTMENAMKNAWSNFLNNCFHPILGTFFTNEYDDQIIREEKIIGGEKYEVVRSHLGIRGKLPEDFYDEWLKQFEKDLAVCQLPTGIHWIRFYYGQHQRQTSACEILYDNNPWEEMQKKAQQYSYCPSDDFYSTRTLYILHRKPDVNRLARIIALASEEEVNDALIEYGLSPMDASKAYLFIQHAFGQVLIRKILNNCSFSDRAVITDGDKKYSILWAHEFFYTEAIKLGELIMGEGNLKDRKLLQSIATCSAEFNALNNALHNGSTIESLEGASFGEAMMEIQGYVAGN